VFFINLLEKCIAHQFSDITYDEIEANGMNIFHYISNKYIVYNSNKFSQGPPPPPSTPQQP
jgi:hypothetical protein